RSKMAEPKSRATGGAFPTGWECPPGAADRSMPIWFATLTEKTVSSAAVSTWTYCSACPFGPMSRHGMMGLNRRVFPPRDGAGTFTGNHCRRKIKENSSHHAHVAPGDVAHHIAS